MLVQLEVRVGLRGEIQAAPALRGAQPYCVARGTSISAERVPSAFLQVLGTVHQPTASLAARIPPDGSSRRWVLRGSPRCHRVEAWPCKPCQFWGRGLHIHHVDYNTPTPALCRSGYTWPEATIKQVGALKRTFRRVVSGPKICPRPAGLSLRRGLRHTTARVRGVLDAPPAKSSTVANCG